MGKVDSFSSKILLFGEYSVIQDSGALLIPYELFEGRLCFSRQGRDRRDSELYALGTYIKRLESSGQLNFPFDIGSYEFDVGQGLIFESSIPQGHGLGSSGALIAALYYRYSVGAHSKRASIEELKDSFSLLESHFHGSSSGLDPLVSYLKAPILKENSQGIRVVELPSSLVGEAQTKETFFLLNTGRSRKTEPLVNLFLEKCKSPKFSSACEKVLRPVTDLCIENFLLDRGHALWESFFELSLFQYENLTPMIPKLYHDVWERGLKEKNFLLKLCGAGGGGFILGLCRDFKACKEDLKNFELRKLFS